MYSGVDEKLFVKKDNHILNGTQDFRLNTERSVWLAQFDERSQDICIDGTRMRQM
jgi:hypothetical protein